MGLRDKRAIVCAASKGLGRACAFALAREGARVTIAARSVDALEAAAREIEAETGSPAIAVTADITSPAGRAALLAACPEPDILITNVGGEPFGDFREWTHDDWQRALDTTMLAPIALITATIDGMIARQFGRIINITSSSVKAPLPHLGLTNGARSGFTGFVAGVAREVAAHGVTINNILPGTFETDRFHDAMRYAATRSGRTYEEEVALRKKAIPAHRIGAPDELGALAAYLSSVHAGFITGQNFLMDGGTFPGTV